MSFLTSSGRSPIGLQDERGGPQWRSIHLEAKARAVAFVRPATLSPHATLREARNVDQADEFLLIEWSRPAPVTTTTAL